MNITSEKSRRFYRNHKDKILQYHKEYYQKNRDEILESKREWYQKNKEKKKAYDKEHRCLESYRILDRKYQAKRNRNLGFNVLIENSWDCEVHYHHLNNTDVIPIPAYLHRMCYAGNNVENHRELCNGIINVLYGNLFDEKIID